ASYDWNSGEATTLDPAPDTNLPDPLFVSPPGTPVVTEELYVTADGSAAKSKAVVTWPASPDAFVRDYQVEYKLTAATEYTTAGRTFATTLEVLDMAPGTYDFRVKAYNNLGVPSAYASTVAEIFGLTAPPANIANFSLNPIHNNAHLSWSQVADLDVRVGGHVRIRHTAELVTPSWSSAVDVAPALPGVAAQAVVPLLDGTYLAKAVDSSGNESTTAATIKSTVANVVKMNRVITVQEDPAFAGSLGNLVYLDGGLQLGGAGVFDNVAGDFDDAQGLFDGGSGQGFTSAASYTFTGGHNGDPDADLGKVTTARITAGVTATIYDPTVTFDESAGDFDSRSGLFDGEDIAGINIFFEVRTSDDDITYTPYRRFIVGDYTARYFQFRLRVFGTQASFNILITELWVTIDVPDVTDSGSLETSASGVTTVPFAKDFYTAPDVGVTIQSAAVGDQEIVQNVTDGSFDVGVKDSGGAFVACTVSWAANGY
ncbi:MAG TPA: hypothetical protein VD866_01960, partial [Urbifossiella sp.]|nr:hypothetical protein [Urbifossiella sp.]